MHVCIRKLYNSHLWTRGTPKVVPTHSKQYLPIRFAQLSKIKPFSERGKRKSFEVIRLFPKSPATLGDFFRVGGGGNKWPIGRDKLWVLGKRDFSSSPKRRRNCEIPSSNSPWTEGTRRARRRRSSAGEGGDEGGHILSEVLLMAGAEGLVRWD